MEITKEKVLEKAKELSLELTPEEVEKYVKDGKLPEKESDDLEKADLKDLIKMIKEQRAENAERRVENKKLKEKLEGIDKDKEKEKKKLLEEQGEFKKLYEDTLAKLNDYEPVVNEYKEYQNKKREQYKKDFGDKWIDSFNSVPLSELEVLHGKFTDTKPETSSSNHKPEQQRSESKTLFKYNN